MGNIVNHFMVNPSTPPVEPDLYTWYTDLDLNLVPFHVGAGGWGDQEPVTAPTPPTTGATATVTSDGEFGAALVNGTAITVSTGTALSTQGIFNKQDIDIILEGDASIAGINIIGNCYRIRVRGTGLIDGDLDLAIAGPITDIIIDEVQHKGRFVSESAFAISRISYTNVLNYQPAQGHYFSANPLTDVVMAGCNMENAGGWWVARYEKTWRRVLLYDCQIENGSGNPMFRPTAAYTPAPESGLFWVDDSVIVSNVDASVLRIHGAADDIIPVSGAWVGPGTTVYCNASVNVPELGAYPAVFDDPVYWSYCKYLRVEGTVVTDSAYDPADVEAAETAAAGEDWLGTATVLPETGNDIPAWGVVNGLADPATLA